MLQSLLALSSLHRYGVQSQAIGLKNSSLKALAASSNPEGSLGVTEVTQHIAAVMLLCSFEVRTQLGREYLPSANAAMVRYTNLPAPQANGHATLLLSNSCSVRPLLQGHKSMMIWLFCWIGCTTTM